MFLTNLCRLFLISLSSHQHLQTVVWSIPRKIWGRDGRCTVPQPFLQSGTSPMPVPHHSSPLLCTAQERAAGRFDMLQALSPSTQVQYSRSRTTFSITKCSAAHSLVAGAWALPTVLLTRAVLLCSGKANAEKASCFLALWHRGHSLPLLPRADRLCRLPPPPPRRAPQYCLLPSLLTAPLVSGFCVPVHFWGCQE